MEGFPKDCVSLTPYRKEETHLSCDDGIALHGSRIVVPKSLRKEILRRLHSSHQGVTSTLRRSRQLVFWPGITSDIKSTAEACQQCQIHRPSLCKEPMMAKKETHFFSNVGCPEQLESDGGPQFTARETNSFLRRWGVEQRVSTPHFPQSPNGLAESAGPPMKIKLKAEAVSTYVNGARPIPLALEKKVKQKLDGLEERRVVTRVSEPTEWCQGFYCRSKGKF
ncbi:hypothetical protein TCAL_15219 [Tigriopus californicus]|uniref:RNA-directed DNA polymerase n=1 Tax=Tigriopus californicus TaxID=6832 RepID=A0A553NG08_TIGCA|nr:hypothetical protein TCAL_15219 [Tigriopus californicus]